MFLYNLHQEIVDKMSKCLKNGKYFYNYKKINFLTNIKNNNKYLIVLFHGAVNPRISPKIIFRGYNFDIANADIICIADYILEKYDDLLLTWYNSTKKYNIDSLYQEIIGFFIKEKKYNDVIFTGTSGGGYPSLYYSSIFNGTALIGNGQIYIEHYPYYKTLKKKLKEYNDDLIYYNKKIEDIIIKSLPKKIILYINLKDHTIQNCKNAYHLPLIDFLEKNNLLHILDLKSFNGAKLRDNQIHQHSVSFINNDRHEKVLNDLINKKKKINY